MKSLYRLFSIVALCIGLTACSDDDGNKGGGGNGDDTVYPSQNDVVGTWEFGNAVYVFNNDYSCRLYGLNLSKAVDATTYYNGRWTLNNQNLTINVASLVQNSNTTDFESTLLYQITAWGNGKLSLLDVSTNETMTGTPTTNPVEPETPGTQDDWSGNWLNWPFAKGADVSYVTQMEDEGFKFHHTAANGSGEGELMEILKDDCGVNAIRLRVWVNPKPMRPGGAIYNDLTDVLVKAKRADSLGLKLMVDFHFSDYWADPSKQWLPDAWKGMTVDQIKSAMTDHINTTLTALKNEGVNPKWVQLGNEVTWGMLWDPAYSGEDPSSSPSNNQSMSPISGQPNGNNFTSTQAKNFSGYVQAAYDAVKAIDPSICTIVHITDAWQCYWDNSGAWIFNILETNKVDYDMIGLSLYPTQDGGYSKSALMSKYVNPAISNAKKLTGKYGRPVIFAEVGMPWDDPEGGSQLIQAIMDAAKTDQNLRGIFYWEPEVNPRWEAEGTGKNGYTLGAFNPADNSPTGALSPFLTNMN